MPPTPDSSQLVMAIDPGHIKCGLAILGADGTIVRREVVPADRLVATLHDCPAVAVVVVGDGTRSADVLAQVREHAAAPHCLTRDETGTSLLGRARYWLENPPRGLWRLIPTSLRLPPEPFDDWVAVILAERYLAEESASDVHL